MFSTSKTPRTYSITTALQQRRWVLSTNFQFFTRFRFHPPNPRGPFQRFLVSTYYTAALSSTLHFSETVGQAHCVFTTSVRNEHLLAKKTNLHVGSYTGPEFSHAESADPSGLKLQQIKTVYNAVAHQKLDVETSNTIARHR